MSAYFVTATGTDIGKTFVTAGLLRRLRAQGRAVSALKPVVSGFAMATAAQSDPGQLLAALGEPVTPETVARIAPWRYAAPLSPDMAAAREGREIPYDEMVGFCRRAAETAGTLLIEGVGGVMVPLDAQHTVLDWMSELRLPVILVAGSYLGTISHTLTALSALGQRGLALAALALNDTGQSPVPLGETAAAIARFAGDVPIVTIARAAADGDFAPLAACLA
ncbi:MAG: dethiobiotin synthase [Alphaproteobacteria bacterium]|nr:dethiobiotin synthase [Alphaproteobacteria bacterium]